jgi:hypothetical protein
MRTCFGVFLIVGLSFGLSGGCRTPDRLTHDNFNHLRQSTSTEADVIAELGEPDHRMPGLWIYQRPEEHVYVKIEFDESGRMTRKEWIDGVTGNWEDTADRPDAKP